MSQIYSPAKLMVNKPNGTTVTVQNLTVAITTLCNQRIAVYLIHCPSFTYFSLAYFKHKGMFVKRNKPQKAK